MWSWEVESTAFIYPAILEFSPREGSWFMDLVVQLSIEKPLSKDNFCYLILILLSLTTLQTTALNWKLNWPCNRQRVITEEPQRNCSIGHQNVCFWKLWRTLVLEKKTMTLSVKGSLTWYGRRMRQESRYIFYSKGYTFSFKIIKSLYIFYRSFQRYLK